VTDCITYTQPKLPRIKFFSFQTLKNGQSEGGDARDVAPCLGFVFVSLFQIFPRLSNKTLVVWGGDNLFQAVILIADQESRELLSA